VPFGFDPDHYRELCRFWQAKADKYRRTKEARGFGVGGRQRQRAYYDSLRDLATPAMGHPPWSASTFWTAVVQAPAGATGTGCWTR
jgi:hypothetical protein